MSEQSEPRYEGDVPIQGLDPTLSRDASHSTYWQASYPDMGEPPPGNQVEQSLGTPTQTRSGTGKRGKES